ncbi:vesicle-associated membrane protein 8-like [Scomber scombrus]|uniref:vesicle-associated membrane protein 8-like n=1 Tax=Scomber scombrus TaxID=13677 RepID=UPI002DD83202|nr:vesicle-associated membrane protein 8-like [Scomber scombrus]
MRQDGETETETEMEQRGVAAEPVPQTKMQTLNVQLDEVKDEMIVTVDKMLIGLEKVDELVMKTGEMEKAAQIFERTGKKVARFYWWKNVKLVVLVVVVVLIIVLVIVLLATGVIPTSSPVRPIVTPTSKP